MMHGFQSGVTIEESCKGCFHYHPSLVRYVDNIPFDSIPQPRKYNDKLEIEEFPESYWSGLQQSLLHIRSARNLASRKINGQLRKVDS